ncbi:MAG: hypothetical protein L0Y72_09215 [Gemmataceae bacterium]|nr:hypothetical protein [Gemmataceae bacterium]MCI0739211.1 hypothetical protein [Gemmataceae bacterium]
MRDTRFSARPLGGNEGADRLEQAWDAQTIIDLVDNAASVLLKAHGFDSWPRLVDVSREVQAATGYPQLPVYSMPESTPATAQHAARLLEVLRQVRAFLYSNGSLNDGVILGMRFGIAVEQAGLADLIPLAKRPVRLTPASNGAVVDEIQALPNRGVS